MGDNVINIFDYMTHDLGQCPKCHSYQVMLVALEKLARNQCERGKGEDSSNKESVGEATPGRICQNCENYW